MCIYRNSNPARHQVKIIYLYEDGDGDADDVGDYVYGKKLYDMLMLLMKIMMLHLIKTSIYLINKSMD